MDRVKNMCLLPHEERAMVEDNVTLQTLRQCVEAWDRVQSCMRATLGTATMGMVFHRPAEMLDHVFLTAILCYAHSQVHEWPSP